MAIKQIVPIFLTLLGDNATTTFVFPVQNMYQQGFGGSVPFGITGSIPSSVSVNNPPFPVTSATVDANGNITITFTSAPPVTTFTLELDITYNSGSATSSSPTVSQNVTLTGTSTVAISGTVAVTQSTSPWVDNLTQVAGVTLGATAVTNFGTAPAAAAVPGVNSSIFSGTTALTNTGGSLNVNITGGSSGNAAASATGSAVPASAGYTGLNVVGTLRGWTGVNPTGTVYAGQMDFTSLNGVSLGSPSNYGTSPGAVSVQGVNAFITNTVPVTLTSTTITGTVAVTQSTSPWVVNMTQWASTALGTPTNFGTTPTAVIAGSVNASLFIGTTAARSNQTTTATGVQDVNIVGSLGATNSVTNGTFIAITDNTTKAGVIAGTTALKTDWSSQAGTAITTVPVAFGTGTPANNAPGVNAAIYVGTTPARTNQTTTATGTQDFNLTGIIGVTAVAASAGVLKTGISGATGVTLDAVITAATSPANGIMGLSVYQATQPSLTTGQSVAIQNDSAGNLLVSLGCNVTTGAAWATATALNTAQYISGTTTIGSPIGRPAIIIQLNQTTTLTAGAVTFEGTYDGTNWVTIPVAQVVHPETFALLTNPYTFVASTNQPFMILMQGYQNMRLRLSTAITGTGTVTPFWDSRNHAPLQTIAVSASTAGALSAATGSIGATKTAVKTSAGSVYGWYFYNSNSAVAYVQFFANTVAGVTLGTTAPTMSLGIPPGSAANVMNAIGLTYATAITIAITTGRANAASPTNSVDYNVFYL